MTAWTIATLILGLQPPSQAPELIAGPAAAPWSASVSTMVAGDALGLELHRCHWRAVPPIIQARFDTLSRAEVSWTQVEPATAVASVAGSDSRVGAAKTPAWLTAIAATW